MGKFECRVVQGRVTCGANGVWGMQMHANVFPTPNEKDILKLKKLIADVVENYERD